MGLRSHIHLFSQRDQRIGPTKVKVLALKVRVFLCFYLLCLLLWKIKARKVVKFSPGNRVCNKQRSMLYVHVALLKKNAFRFSKPCSTDVVWRVQASEIPGNLNFFFTQVVNRSAELCHIAPENLVTAFLFFLLNRVGLWSFSSHSEVNNTEFAQQCWNFLRSMKNEEAGVIFVPKWNHK